jgi:exosome complex protein LRP1
METPDLHPLLEDLETQIDDLTDSLSPFLAGPLSYQTSKLPLLDQAKLYVLATYAIESLLFSSLRLSGVDAKAHPVFQELGRVKEYFQKIKAAETGGAGAKKGGSGRIDKEAAGRFIRAGLAGNERLDRERERAGAKRKLESLSEGVLTRFDGVVTEDEGSSAKEGIDVGTTTMSGEQPSRKKHEGRKAPKAANRFGAEYADLATRDLAEEAAKGDGQVSIHSNSDDEGEDSTAAQAPHKMQSEESKKPKNSKEALASLIDGTLEDKSGKRKRKKSRKKLERQLQKEREEAEEDEEEDEEEERRERNAGLVGRYLA